MAQRSVLNRTGTSSRMLVSGMSAVTATLAGGYALVGGVITLVGWALDLPRLTDWKNDDISMFANAAMCAIMGGAGLILLASQRGGWRWNVVTSFATRIAASVVAVIGGLTLLEHLFGWNLGIDTLLFDRPWGQRAAAAPMRMGPPASTSFLIVGIGLLLATYGPRARRMTSVLAILTVAITSLSLTGYWFGADYLFGVARLTGIAWQTSTMLAALGLGLMAAVPEHGLIAAIQRDDASDGHGQSCCAPFSG